MERKPITISLTLEAIKKIDEARIKDQRTRSNFISVYALEKAENLLNENEE